MKKLLFILLFICTVPVFAKEFRYDPNTMKVYEIDVPVTSENVQIFTQLIEKLLQTDDVKNSDLSNAYFRRGYYYEKVSKDFDNALIDYNIALKYNPDNKDALISASYIKLKFKDSNGALQDLKKLILLEPNDPDWHIMSAFLYTDLKQYNASINECTKAITIKNKNPNAFYWRGLNEIKIGKFENGLRDLDYAKRQYCELNDIKNYKHVSNVIDTLNNPVKTMPVKQYYSNNTQSVNELRQINENLQNINRNMMMQNTNSNRDIEILKFLSPAPTYNKGIDVFDLFMLMN